MWDLLLHPWPLCLEQAWKAYCAGDPFVGAVVTDPAGEVVSHGGGHRLDNGCLSIATPGMDGVARPLAGHPLAHAELQALLSFDYAQIDPRTCALYTTLEPCPLCAGALVMSNVRHLHYACRDPWAGSVGLLRSTPFIRMQGIQVSGPHDGALQEVLTAVNVEHCLRGGRPRRHIDAWTAVSKRAVEAGVALLRSGRLQELRRASAPTAEVIDEIAALIRQMPNIW
jgi:tRNA(adenine34) deaminase